jgi:hypothetical protein
MRRSASEVMHAQRDSGTISVAAHAGLNSVHFEGRLSNSASRTPGKYMPLITAITARVGSTSETLRFTIGT